MFRKFRVDSLFDREIVVSKNKKHIKYNSRYSRRIKKKQILDICQVYRTCRLRRGFKVAGHGHNGGRSIRQMPPF